MFIRPTLREHHSVRAPFRGTEPTSGKMAEIIAKIRAPDPVMWEYKFTPIYNLPDYLRMLKIYDTPDDEIELIEAKHKSVTPPTPRIIPPPQPYTPKVVAPQKLYIKTRIKGSKVKISIVDPYEKLFQHIRKNEPVPIESFVQFHALNGAPDKFLLNVMKKYDRGVKSRDADNEILDKIFDKYISKPKKPLKAVKKLPPVFE